MQRIAYFGPSGTFTETALAQLESDGVVAAPVERVPAGSPPAALDLVRDGTVDGACVPVESSVDGPVVPTLDALAVGERLQICAETELDVSFAILARPGTALAAVHTVGAYPVAAAQVQQWLRAHLPDAEVRVASSNAGAAEDVAAGKVDAAVSTHLAGERLELDELASGIADVAGARTRFLLVRRPAPVPTRTGHDRTAVVFELPNEPGSLASALNEFAIRGVDLTRVQSRPTRTGLGTYRFYVDCAGHVDDTAVREALKALHHRCPWMRFLGSWPAQTQVGNPPPQDGAAEEWIEALRQGGEAR